MRPVERALPSSSAARAPQAAPAADSARRMAFRWLRWPLSGGAREIQALDGWRALAALGVLFLHAYLTVPNPPTFHGHALGYIWYYFGAGVHLFFILSGFLLFQPYARAILRGEALPSPWRFYKRRALRILPAYWACLAILVLVNLTAYLSLSGLANIATHLVLIHDGFYQFNRAIEGPFWTLAVEAQFYLLLPLVAAGIARVVGRSRSPARLIAGVVGFIAAAVLLREADAAGQAILPRTHGIAQAMLSAALHVTMGAQGKYLEVFGVGMLASVLYAVTAQARAANSARLRRAGALLFLFGVALVPVLAREVVGPGDQTPPFDLVNQPLHPLPVVGPLLLGISFGAMVLGVLWGPRLLRAPFEWRPLRFVGLISYSLYLWHQPLIFAAAPFTSRLPGTLALVAALGVGFGLAIPFAYVSYSLVERPFLQRRDASPRPSASARAASLPA
ncbi:MAG TPA: acyltransferase [Ktedonobacterales bacterium]